MVCTTVGSARLLSRYPLLVCITHTLTLTLEARPPSLSPTRTDPRPSLSSRQNITSRRPQVCIWAASHNSAGGMLAVPALPSSLPTLNLHNREES